MSETAETNDNMGEQTVLLQMIIIIIHYHLHLNQS